jgi:FMN phosphatase YigB (HAD superfamily)
VVVASAEEGCSKPNLKIFELALARANCTTNEAVMIGDRLDNDIVPAKQIGMKTIWVRQGFAKYKSVKNDDENADYTVEEIKDILKILS